MGMRSNSSSQRYRAWRNSSRLYSPRSLMPSCLRTVLAPPSQPTIYDAPIASPVPFACFTRERHGRGDRRVVYRSEEHTSELQSHSDLVCRLLLEKKKKS